MGKKIEIFSESLVLNEPSAITEQCEMTSKLTAEQIHPPKQSEIFFDQIENVNIDLNVDTKRFNQWIQDLIKTCHDKSIRHRGFPQLIISDLKNILPC